MHRSTRGLLNAFSMLCLLTAAALPSLAHASKKKDPQAEYLTFMKTLPGSYDNLSQADDSAGQVQPVILSIRPLEVQLVGKAVLLVRETAANDPNRLLAQHLWTVDQDKQGQIVQHVYQFKEPQRWMRAGDDMLLFQSLLPDDLQLMAGCEIYWTKTADGFTGAARPHACRPASSQEGHLVEIGAEVGVDDLTLTELQAGAGGRLPADAHAAAANHYQRRGA